MSIEFWWDDTDRRKAKHSEINLSQGQFAHHKYHKDWPGIERGPPRWVTGVWPLALWHVWVLWE